MLQSSINHESEAISPFSCDSTVLFGSFLEKSCIILVNLVLDEL